MRDDDPWSGLTPPRSPASGGGIGAVLREFHVPWPTANETSLRDAATIWHQLAETFRDNYAYANRAATSLTSNNEGAAISAFEQYWDKYGARNKGALPLAAEACDSMSTACSKYADEVSGVKRRIEDGVETMVATVALGAVGAFFTFGITEVAATSAATAFAAAAAEWVDGISVAIAEWIAETGSGLASITAIISGAAGDAIADGTATLASAAASGTDALATGIGSSGGIAGTFAAGTAGGVASAILTAPMSEPESNSQLATAIVESGLEGGVGGMLGQLGGLTASQLTSVLDHAAQSVSTTDPQLFVSLTTLSKQVAGMTGKVSTSVLSSAASQLVVAQNVNASNLAQDQLQDRLQQIAERGEG